MIDVHCHLLPGIDDGSRSVAQSVAVLREFATQGVTDVILTPHLDASALSALGERAIAQRQEALDALSLAAPARPRLSLGFEIMLDQPLPALGVGDRRFALAGSRYYLVEFPMSIVPSLAATVLMQMTRAGVVPLIAHPERYQWCSREAVAGWRQAGARIQLDATTLTRSTARGQRARELLAAGLVDLVAADNHGDGRSMGIAAQYLRRYAPQRVVDQLTRDNPGAILTDRVMADPPPAARVREGWVNRLAALLGL